MSSEPVIVQVLEGENAILENNVPLPNFGFGHVILIGKLVETRTKMSIRSSENRLLQALISVEKN